MTIEMPSLSAGGQQAVELLTHLLNEAKSGKITGLAAILPQNGQVNVHITGAASAADLYFGAGLLQHQVLGIAQEKPSSFLRVPSLRQ